MPLIKKFLIKLDRDSEVYYHNIQKLLVSKPKFDWDEGNSLKNWQKHGVSMTEAESVFKQLSNLLVLYDLKHSTKEPRAIVIGLSNYNRVLYIVCTLRSRKVRIISARRANKQERKKYEKIQKNTKI